MCPLFSKPSLLCTVVTTYSCYCAPSLLCTVITVYRRYCVPSLLCTVFTVTRRYCVPSQTEGYLHMLLHENEVLFTAGVAQSLWVKGDWICSAGFLIPLFSPTPRPDLGLAKSTVDTRHFPRGKNGRGVKLPTRFHLAPMFQKE